MQTCYNRFIEQATTMDIDKFNPSPLYMQAANRLKEMITDKLAPNEEIPSEGDLEKLFEVSRITIRRAIDVLVSEGLLVKAKGKRTCVAPAKIEQPLSRISGFSDTIKSAGLKPETTAIEITRERLPGFYDEILRGVSFSRDVVRVKRIRTADGSPISQITSYLPEELVPGLVGSSLLNDSLFHTLAVRYGIVLKKAEQILEAIPASEEMGRLLGVSRGYPLLSLKQLTFNQQDQVVELADVLSRADRYRYHVNLIAGMSTTSTAP